MYKWCNWELLPKIKTKQIILEQLQAETRDSSKTCIMLPGEHMDVAVFLMDSNAFITDNICQRFPEMTSRLVSGRFQKRKDEVWTDILKECITMGQ